MSVLSFVSCTRHAYGEIQVSVLRRHKAFWNRWSRSRSTRIEGDINQA